MNKYYAKFETAVALIILLFVAFFFGRAHYYQYLNEKNLETPQETTQKNK